MNIVDFLLGRLMSAGAGSSEPTELPELSNPAAAADISKGKDAINSAGKRVVGTMPENPAVVITLDTDNTDYFIPAGRHDGEGWVGIELEEKIVDITEEPQTVTPSDGKVLSKVTVPGLVAEIVDGVFVVRLNGGDE